MFNNILIPVDMAHTEKATDMVAAARQVAADDAHFILATIVHSVPAVAELSVSQEYFDMAAEEARNELEKIAKDENLDATLEMRVGQPANDILAIAADKKADLIIVGSHRPGFQDYLLGSTASRVVRHAQCPVLVMR